MPGNARFLAGPARQKAFDDAVFEGMKGYDDQSSTRLEYMLGRRQSAHEFAEFIVDVDTQRLERPRRGMPAVGLAAVKYAQDEIREFGGPR